MKHRLILSVFYMKHYVLICSGNLDFIVNLYVRQFIIKQWLNTIFKSGVNYMLEKLQIF
jgi:hypothetical protein